MNDEEITSKRDRCEICKYYIMIDSGFGYCRRFPPKEEKIRIWKPPKWEIHYQLTEWCRKACGEFKRVEDKTNNEKQTLEAKLELTKEALDDLFDERIGDDFSAGKFLIELIREAIKEELEKKRRRISDCECPAEISIKIKTKKWQKK